MFTLHFFICHAVYLRCEMYYLFDLHTASIALLSILGEGSLLCCSPRGFSHFSLWNVGFSLEVFPCTMWGSKDRGCRFLILIFCTNCAVVFAVKCLYCRVLLLYVQHFGSTKNCLKMCYINKTWFDLINKLHRLTLHTYTMITFRQTVEYNHFGQFIYLLKTSYTM